MMKRLLAIFVLLAPACGDGAGSADAAQGPDAGVRPDATIGVDAFEVVADDAALPSDAGSTVDASGRMDAPIASDASAAADVGSVDTGCTYIDEPRIVFCVDTYEYVREWISIDGPRCPPYATGTDGERYATLLEAIAGSACEDACVWRASTSVSLLRCGRRTGYIEFTASGCDSLFETPDGIFRSIDEWNAAAPCPP